MHAKVREQPCVSFFGSLLPPLPLALPLPPPPSLAPSLSFSPLPLSFSFSVSLLSPDKFSKWNGTIYIGKEGCQVKARSPASVPS